MGFAHGYRYAQIDGTSAAQQYVQAFVDTGAKWWRMNMESWNTAEFDDLLARLPADVCVLGNISSTPNGWQDPPDHQAWANAAAAEVARYKGRIHVWEIWNEPNLAGFWPSRSSDSWTDLLRRTYTAIKAVDPTATVLGSCCAPQGGSTDPYNAVNWWTRVYAANGGTSAGLFDGIAHHPYLYPNDPTDPANFQPWSGFYQTLLLHNLMASHGDGAKRVWGTEAGAPTECSPSEWLSLADEAARIPREFDIWIDQWGAFTGPLFFHQLQNQGDQPTSSHEHWMGIVRTDWTHKDPMWTAWHDYSLRS